MKIQALNIEGKYTRAMKQIENLININVGEGPLPGSADVGELGVRAILAEKYEEEHFPILAPIPPSRL